jgi:hypothetical protein
MSSLLNIERNNLCTTIGNAMVFPASNLQSINQASHPVMTSGYNNPITGTMMLNAVSLSIDSHFQPKSKFINKKKNGS